MNKLLWFLEDHSGKMLGAVVLVLVFGAGQQMGLKRTMECGDGELFRFGTQGSLYTVEFEHGGDWYRCFSQKPSQGQPGGLWCQMLERSE